jgi:uncharacterized RDD family membrane protein YckC
MTATGDLWLIRAGGQDYGPYTADQVKAFIQEGRVLAQTEIAAAGGAVWTNVASLPVFAALFAPTPSAPSALRPAAPGAVAAGERAGFWPRVGALLIDGIILLAAQLVVGGVVGAIVGGTLAGIVNIGMSVAYFVVLHAAPRQATFGKSALSLRVMRDDAAPMTRGDAFKRYLAAMLSGLTIVGLLLPLFRADRKTLHDILCGTHVARVSR